MNVWRVNARTHEFTMEPIPLTWQSLGGRGLLACILLDEVDATRDLPGADNKLIFAPGFFVGPVLNWWKVPVDGWQANI